MTDPDHARPQTSTTEGSKTRFRVFAACSPGLEPLLAAEIRGLGHEATETPGGVELISGREGLLRLLFELGLASHVLVRVAQFPVRELAELEAHVARLPWSGWLRRDVPRRVRATSQRSRLYHTGAIEERVWRAISTRLGDSPRPAEPEDAVPLAVRMFEDRCTISLDVSGPPLHRRGYRLDPQRAPLREDLARALIVVSQWDVSRPLVDPMCGSGTIAIEAARLATRHAPGLERSFAIEQTALADEASIQEIRASLRERIRESPVQIVARDRDPRAVIAARENAARAGVASSIAFEVGPLSSTREGLERLGLGGPVAIVTNPPWGERLGEADRLRPLYEALGSLVRSLPRSSLAFAAHDRSLAHATGVPIESALLTDLGGMKVALMHERRSRAAPEPR